MRKSSQTEFPQRLLIGKSWWRILIGRVPGTRGSRHRNLGLCDYSTHTIHVSESLGAANRLSTLLHEVIHAAIPEAKEEHVVQAERTIARLLKRIAR